MKLHYLLILLLMVSSLLSQSTVQQQPGAFYYTVQTTPAAISTSSVCVVGFANGCLLKLNPGDTDPYLCGADFTATGQTITLTDANNIPWVVGGGTLGSVGNPTGWVFVAPNDTACRVFPGGLNIIAGGSGATGRLTIKYNKR